MLLLLLYLKTGELDAVAETDDPLRGGLGAVLEEVSQDVEALVFYLVKLLSQKKQDDLINTGVRKSKKACEAQK